MNSKRILLCAALVSVSLGISQLATANPTVDPGYMSQFVPKVYPPLANWKVDSESFIGQLKTQHKGVKAASDPVSVYRPVPVCRLVDTRGYPAAIAVPGPIAANTTTTIDAAGFCGIPDNGMISGISLSFHVQNQTVNNGGFITFVQTGAGITGTNAVFNPGAQWTAATANVSIPNGSGSMDMRIANSTVHVIIDVNGYYQDMNELDTVTQLDIQGATIGDALGVTNTVGRGLSVQSPAAETALTIGAGRFRVAGAGVGTDTVASVHEVNTAADFGAGGTRCSAAFPSFSVIDNAQANGDPNAIVFITPKYNGVLGPNSSYEVYYYTSGSCATAVNDHWMIHRTDGNAHLNGYQFNVLVIKR